MTKLMRHQIEDAAFLASQHIAGNFSEMGTGKTLTALEAVNEVEIQRLLIAAPPAVLYMWRTAVIEHCGEPDAFIPASGRKLTEWLHNYRTLITSYDMIARNASAIKKWLGAHESAVIADEAHALKNWDAKRTQAFFGIDGICEHTDHLWCLTGTPITRWVDDIFPFLLRANPVDLCQLIGSEASDTPETLRAKFQMRYCLRRQKRYGRFSPPVWEIYDNRKERLPELNDLLYGNGEYACAVRRELRDVADSIPECTHTELLTDGDPDLLVDDLQQALADADDILQKAKDTNIARLRRAFGMLKVKVATDHITNVIESTGYPVLVGAWHRDVIGVIESELRGNAMGDPLVITGDTPAKERDKIATAFNERRCCALIGQIQAAGTGINLQSGGSHRIVIVEESSSPQDMEQFYARLVRMGQKNHVHVDTIRTRNEVERALVGVGERKTQGVTEVVVKSSDIHILGLSGGKDSAALAIYMRDKHPEFDMQYFFSDTDKELPETYEFIDKLEAYLCKPITRIKYDGGFDGALKANNNYLPSFKQRWCTRMLKLEPMEKWIGQFVNTGQQVYNYVGIRADEHGRAGYKGKHHITTRLPFVENNIVKADVYKILNDAGVGLPSYYRWRTRSGCYFCFFQRRIEWVNLLREHPDLYDKAQAYETANGFTWSDRESLADLRKPARVKQIRENYAKRIARARERGDNTEIPLDIDDAYPDSPACDTCHK